ncbi:YfhO family protein [Domibacillus sp. 8LH]|uniref:YfhO family protein n=1 Tax=Domibacillus sp. 8LH TaxID=3073900 RepID=UPI003180EED5
MQKRENTSTFLHKISHSGKKASFFFLFLSSLIIALLSHLFFIIQWFDGQYMTGMNDGLSQMQPFKELLYNEFKKGEFFYSPDFGLGGSIYTQLSYYFFNSIIFLLTTGVTFVLESIGLIGKPDLFYWADAILVVSVLRLTVILMITTFYFWYMTLSALPAFVGAVVYGTSIIYFRYVTYWEFFSDSMIWLPLLLIGVEKVIREEKPWFFLAAVSVSLFDNFYFSYVNFLLAGIYILFRWIFKLSEGETSVKKQIKLFLLTGIAGFGISAFSFIPAVYGFLNNYRPPYTEQIPLIGFTDNFLINGLIVYIPAFVVLSLMLVSLYQNPLFRFFAFMTIFLVLLHMSPYAASVFNGFSAPQYRWEHLLSLTVGGTAAAALSIPIQIKRKKLMIAFACAAVLYILFYVLDPVITFQRAKDAWMGVSAFIVVAVFFVLVIRKSRHIKSIMALLIILTSIGVANAYQENRLSVSGTSFKVSKEYMNSDQYRGADQQKVIALIQEQETDPLARIDWTLQRRNNTPIIHGFKGMSAYSSILNEHLLFFYLKDLYIDMGWESVSRYGTLGDRANLESLLMGKYYIKKKEEEAVPYGFKEAASAGEYVAYQNENLLPFVRTTSTVFSERELKNASPVAKEHAMLSGIVLDRKEPGAPIPESTSIMKRTSVEPVHATYEKDILKVPEKGGIDVVVNQPNPSVKDYYLTFTLRGIDNKDSYVLQVNEYKTTRKAARSIYKTNVDQLVIRVKANSRISLRVPKGTYELKDVQLYEETYEVLQEAKAESRQSSVQGLRWEGNRISFTYNNTNHSQYAAIPLPYEKGWRLTVNGEKQEIKKANYAFTGIELKEGRNNVELVYYPPFFFLLLALSACTLFLVLLLFYRTKRSTS